MLDKHSTRDQVVVLHTLYGQWSRHSLAIENDVRSARLKWASEAIGREIDSFSDLTRDEARQLINRLKGSMGLVFDEKPNPWRPIRSRDRARAAGTAGRNDGDSSFIQMASADDLARVDEAVRRLSWTPERYKAWLCSPSSLIASKGAVASILTVAEANKLWWALKSMLRRSGRWHAAPSRQSPKENGGSF
jgi:hypothetical protein